ncbi:YihA family ribosome biogenesis GTP-binding protein [bacterium]|nr:YihA family ribosome biogenesis GTP-binding protein [bacterium]
MEIKNAIFYKTIMKLEEMPKEGLFEIALTGRSNVGKSSFINSICNNNKLARTSKTPGKTITLNFYLINNSFYFVDMPGYGYASREKDILYNFSESTNLYVEKRKELKGFISIIDSRTLTNDDKEMIEYLKHRSIPFIIILSKIDKLKRNDIRKRVDIISKELSVNKELIIPYSSYTKENIDKVLNSLETNLLFS